MSKSKIIQAVGVVFLLIGVLGFISDPILGIFDTDLLHNLVHILSGVAALVLGKNEDGATLYGKVFAVVYGLVTVLGFLLPGGEGSILGLLPVNMADNVLHLLLTAVFAYVGFVPTKRTAATA